MPDEQDRSEALDEEIDEPLAHRIEREEPDFGFGAATDLNIGSALIDNTADANPDGPFQAGIEIIDDGESGDANEGYVAEDDPGPFSGDDWTNRVPPPAEEAAIHIIDEP